MDCSMEMSRGAYGEPLGMGSRGSRHLLYKEVLTEVRLIMVSRMAKPEEVLVVETSDGNVEREYMKDTDQIEQYKVEWQMKRSCLLLPTCSISLSRIRFFFWIDLCSTCARPWST